MTAFLTKEKENLDSLHDSVKEKASICSLINIA